MRLAAASMLGLALPLVASAAGPVTVKGKIVGANKLMNPVWNEAKDANLHRFTFREPSATVTPEARTLTAYLPTELCIAALVPGDGKPKGPRLIVIAGGRTSRVTLVVAPGQQIQFENQDPFPHKLYVFGADSKGFGPVEQAAGKARSWTPPGPGKYEIRDELAPSVRSWIVVEPHVASVGYVGIPYRAGEFQIDLDPGSYTLRGYFDGEPIGDELPITVAPLPVQQTLIAPLAVGADESAAGKPAPGKLAPGKLGKHGGGG